ncbi:MAG TPA: TldD/PmbA family protein [Candidatus Eisenbacteria bacterium]
MRSDEARAILDAALALAGDRGMEVVLGGGLFELTRFANNEITQNVSERRYALSVRIVLGRRTGRASGNDLSHDGIAALVARAAESARLAPEIPDLLPLPGPQRYGEAPPPDPATERIGPVERATEVARAVARAKAAGVQAAGIYETGVGTIGDYGQMGTLAIANTSGLFAYHQGTDAAFAISALDGAVSGWAGVESRRASDVDGDALAARAVEKAIRSRNPTRWEPGRYTVVLEPAAVADLLQDTAWLSFGALPVQEGRSFLSGKIGTRIAGENVTIRDDPFHPLHGGAPFDAEGMATRPTTIIERGVAIGPVYDRQTAAKEGKESTGHGLPTPNTFGPIASHVVMEGGSGSADDLVSGVERGLLVTRVWYTNVVDPGTATLTGMTRDGLFAIEKGRISGPVGNFRFNQSIVRMLGEVEAMSEPVRAGGVVCPGLLVRSFQMSSVTEF